MTDEATQNQKKLVQLLVTGYPSGKNPSLSTTSTDFRSKRFVTHYRNGLLRINTGPRIGSGSQLLTLQKQHGRVIFEGFKRNYVKAAYTNSLPVMDVKEDTAVKDVLLVGFGAVGVIYSLVLKRSGKARVTVVARSNFEAVERDGIHIKSEKYGEIPNWRPDRLCRSLDEALDKPYSYVLVATKNMQTNTGNPPMSFCRMAWG
ncbi:hypothetical protein PNOK_0617700 [Pyrrhoderma noxium]|uniref:Ketopantoate reductase N-terminal domain-containing protein n=1 Tax=Pyrrhoderma noxium TaxID=2282107 RepID=A0A286UDL5_9AGAM|nr:hypothetical protein PNOK_0617700 [Pyrrhoderma noxium]